MASRASCKASARFHESHTLCISGGYVHTHTITLTHGHDHFRTDGTHSHRHSSAELERSVEAIPVIGDRYDAEQQKRVLW